MNIQGIAIVGANGSGKTTIGRELAKLLNYKHMDIENYYFKSARIPYTKMRTKEEVEKLLLQDIFKYQKFILSSVNCDYGESINKYYDLVIYIKCPLDIRLKRVRKRAMGNFGERILPGGDMYEQEENFFQFVASRDMKQTDIWLKSLTCPVVYVDGIKDISEILKFLQCYIKKDS